MLAKKIYKKASGPWGPKRRVKVYSKKVAEYILSEINNSTHISQFFKIHFFRG
jgi:hypothetical protein